MTLYSKEDLIKRGWRESDIELLLKQPDYVISGRGYYHETTISQIEDSDPYLHGVKKKRPVQKDLEQAALRAKSRKDEQKRIERMQKHEEKIINEWEKRVEKLKKQNLKLYSKVKSHEINIRYISDYDLLEEARAHFGVDKYWVVDPGSGPKIIHYADWSIGHLQRAAVNYIRHRCTDYDQFAKKIKGEVGASFALLMLRSEIHIKLSKIYPHLENEARRQLISELENQIRKSWLEARGPTRDIWLVNTKTGDEELLERDIDKNDALEEAKCHLAEYFDEYEISDENISVYTSENENYEQTIEVSVKSWDKEFIYIHIEIR